MPSRCKSVNSQDIRFLTFPFNHSKAIYKLSFKFSVPETVAHIRIILYYKLATCFGIVFYFETNILLKTIVIAMPDILLQLTKNKIVQNIRRIIL